MSVSFSPDRVLVASGGADNKTQLLSAVSGQQTAVLQGKIGGWRVLGVSFSRDGKLDASITTALSAIRASKALESLLEAQTEVYYGDFVDENDNRSFFCLKLAAPTWGSGTGPLPPCKAA
eukprot:CAMPEP_0185851396 /NCGR_PEP_ID=MMETSP1354-20130828/9336_1 /TAXON_ID=708628 /ORGANISM="Erythrolobus madagascarensis, Strain CCMP3276" /LENGTH=119 /DNA_ID=CAMNT_0028552373 /DNA_START=1 /DNA_END=361 /DNA_ORIENTATION=-